MIWRRQGREWSIARWFVTVAHLNRSIEAMARSRMRNWVLRIRSHENRISAIWPSKRRVDAPAGTGKSAAEVRFLWSVLSLFKVLVALRKKFLHALDRRLSERGIRSIWRWHSNVRSWCFFLNQENRNRYQWVNLVPEKCDPYDESVGNSSRN